MEEAATKVDDSSLFYASDLNSDLISFFESPAQSPPNMKAKVTLPRTMDMNGHGHESILDSVDDELSPTVESGSKNLTEPVPDLIMEKATSMSKQEPAQKPEITLYFLQTSRSIRIAWLLEELSLEYSVVYYDREPTMAAPDAFKEASGGTMGKAPVLVDGDLVLEESGAITQYLISTYDTLHYLIPYSPPLYAKTILYLHAAEATFLVHALVPFYVHRANPDTPDSVLQALTIDTGNDLDWLDKQIKASATRYLVSDTVTAADTMMGFSIQFILEFGLHPKEENGEGRWDNIKKWLANVESSKAYQRAVAKTGHTLRPNQDGA